MPPFTQTNSEATSGPLKEAADLALSLGKAFNFSGLSFLIYETGQVMQISLPALEESMVLSLPH